MAIAKYYFSIKRPQALRASNVVFILLRPQQVLQACYTDRYHCNPSTMRYTPTTSPVITTLCPLQPLHARYVYLVLRESVRVLRQRATICHASTVISGQITVVGDLHGKLDDLLTILYKVSYLQRISFNLSRQMLSPLSSI